MYAKRLVKSFIDPKCKLYNITSIPDIKTIFNKALWIKSYKINKLDPTEKECVKYNLGSINKISSIPYWHNSVPVLKNHDWKLILGLEQLASAFVYHSPEQDSVVMIGSQNGICRYKVDIIKLYSSISAYGLLPIENLNEKNSNIKFPKLLIFRGTSFYVAGCESGSTVLADIDPDGIGHTLYMKSDKIIKKWLENHSDVIVSGHSLGSAVATYALAYNHQKIKAIYTFGSIKVNNKIAEIINNNSDITNKCIRFYSITDKITNFGQAGCGTEISINPLDEYNELPSNESGNRWRLCTWQHRRTYLNFNCIIKEENRSSDNNSNIIYTLKYTLKYILYICFYLGLRIKRLICFQTF